MREMISDYIALVPDFEVCGTAPTGEKALEELADVEAELVLIDMSLPKMSGVDLVKEVVKQHPQLPCLMYSGYGEKSYAEQALTAGARGYVMKGDPDELIEGIRRVLASEVYLSEVVSKLSNG